MARVSAKVWGMAILALLIGTAIAENGKREAEAYGVSLRIAGSKVPRALMASWSTQFQSATKDMVKPYYGALQTGVAKQYFKESNAVDMIVTDVPLTSDESADIQTTRGSGVAHMPLAVAGLAIAYNKNSLGNTNPLQLSAATLAGIFSGHITNWNDAMILEENPGFSKDLPIKPIIMEGQAGTSRILTSYLNLFDSLPWHISPSYTVDAGVNDTHAATPEEVITLLASIPGSIAYVSYADAASASLNVAAIKNPSGAYVQPSLAALSAAADAPSQALPPTGTSNWVDSHLMSSAAPTAYPISFYVYAIFITEQANAGPNGAALGAFMFWAQTDDAQSITTSSKFGSLPASVRNLNANVTMPNVNYATGVATTDYWPYIAPVAPVPAAPVPVTAPAIKTIASSGLQITIIIVLVILIILVIGYDQYRGGCIIKCNSTGRGIWA